MQKQISNGSIEQIINKSSNWNPSELRILSDVTKEKCNYPEGSDTNHAYHYHIAKITCLELTNIYRHEFNN